MERVGSSPVEQIFSLIFENTLKSCQPPLGPFAYLAIYLARVIGGVAFPLPDFPAEVAALMGTSIISTAVNKK